MGYCNCTDSSEGIGFIYILLLYVKQGGGGISYNNLIGFSLYLVVLEISISISIPIPIHSFIYGTVREN
jgi:hypothetical protein